MFSGPLPDKFTVPVGSVSLNTIYTKNILIDQGYEHIDYLKYSLLPLSARYEYNNLFILGGDPDQRRKPIHHPVIDPFQVFEKLNIPERNITYSEEELNNIFKMLDVYDKDVNRVALTICSKMNLKYIVGTKLGNHLKMRSKLFLMENGDPYSMMLLIYVHNYG